MIPDSIFDRHNYLSWDSVVALLPDSDVIGILGCHKTEYLAFAGF